MSIISLRVNESEKEVLENASKIYNCGISSMIKQIVFEKLENDYDLKVIDEYENKITNGTLEARPIEELWKELGIDNEI